jgi:hypothetical protein
MRLRWAMINKMYFSPELETDEIPNILLRFKSIIGWENLNKKFISLHNQKSDTYGHYLKKRFNLELTLEEIFRYKKNTNRVLWTPNTDQITTYSFMAMVVKVYERLSYHGQNKLSGQLKGDLKNETGLAPTAFEMMMIANLLQNGFHLEFSDLEEKNNTPIYDFLAFKGNKKLEIECKYITGDKGRKIHQRNLHTLVENLKSEIDKLRKISVSNLFISITIKDRLQVSDSYVKLLKNDIIQIFESPNIKINREEHSIKCYIFSNEASPFQKYITEEETRKFIEENYNIQNPHAFVCYNPNHSATVINIKSEQEDSVLDVIFKSALKDSKKQFSQKLPAILCCKLADVSEGELKELQDAQQNENIGIQIMSNMLLDRRPHLLGVGFMTDGFAYKKSEKHIGQPNIFSTQGSVFFFKNQEHPCSVDTDYDIHR